jgi:hypothetical protein
MYKLVRFKKLVVFIYMSHPWILGLPNRGTSEKKYMVRQSPLRSPEREIVSAV